MNINAQVAEMLQADPSLTPKDIAKALQISLKDAKEAVKASEGTIKPQNELDERDELITQLEIEETKAEAAKIEAEWLQQQVEDKQAELAKITGSPTTQAQIYQVPERRGTKSETIPILMLSDWLIEKPVAPAQVMGLNEYNLEIGQRRSDEVIRKFVKLVNLRRRTDTTIDTCIIWCGGGFIASKPAERNEGMLLSPTDAANTAIDRLYSALRFILKNGDFKHIVIPCTAGSITDQPNKNQVTKGNPYEWCIYNKLAELFKHDKRVTFIAPRGQHVQISVFGKLIRLWYGDSINYRDGVGGLTIPLMKRINAWNVGKEAFLDCFGRWRTYMPGRNFVGNGSLIGYTPTAQASGGEFEKPMQALVYIEKRYGISSYEPIFVN